MGEIQRQIYMDGKEEGLVEGREEGEAKTISVLIKNGFPIEDIKRMYSNEYSEEDLQKVLSKAQLLVA